MVIPVLFVMVLLGVVYGWMLQAFLHYRASRQDEVLYLLAGAAESGAPWRPRCGRT